MSSLRLSVGSVLVLAGVATADPAPATPSRATTPSSATPAPSTTTAPVAIAPLLVFEVPALPPPSLRLEAARIAGQRADLDWRYPEPGPLFGSDNGLWFVGYGRYRPRTARSGALHGGSIAATMLGQILLQADSPVAGVGAMLTGATLDAAAADVDRDAETKRPTR